MSENEQGQVQPTGPTGELNELSKAIGETIPEPSPAAGQFKYNDLHTAENTPLKEYQEPVSQTISMLPEEARETGFSTFFLGIDKKDHDKANILVGRWLGLTSVEQAYEKDLATENLLNNATNDWVQFIEAEYPGKSSDEMKTRALSLYRFMDGLQDKILTRTKMVHEEGLTNVSRRGSKLTIADILGQVPSGAGKATSISEQMARAVHQSNSTPYQYTLLLRNSFTQIRFSRPSQLELGNLVNDINNTVRGYVRKVGNNSVDLATIAGMKVIWAFLRDHIIWSSVKDVFDYNDLANIIRITDFQTICNALLHSSSDKGIQMDLGCLFGGCGHSSLELVDPSKMTVIRYSIQTDDEAAIFGNITNGRMSYTTEEVLALIEQSKYGLPDNKIYNESQGICLTIAPPSLAEAFVTFDYFVGQIDPQIANIRSKVVNEEELEQQVNMLQHQLGAAKYIHWVDSFAKIPKADSDEEPKVWKRSETNPDEFNKGLMVVLRADESLDDELTKFVFNKTPYMTRTFSGMRNRPCPLCNKSPADAQEEGRKLGYTPIDSFVTFFTHTQLMLVNLSVEKQRKVKEALS